MADRLKDIKIKLGINKQQTESKPTAPTTISRRVNIHLGSDSETPEDLTLRGGERRVEEETNKIHRENKLVLESRIEMADYGKTKRQTGNTIRNQGAIGNGTIINTHHEGGVTRRTEKIAIDIQPRLKRKPDDDKMNNPGFLGE